jgi:hypothetical protein
VSDPPDWSYKQLLMPRVKYHMGIPGTHPLTGQRIDDGIEVWGGELASDTYYVLHITDGVLYLKNGVGGDTFYTQIYWCNDPRPHADKDIKVGQVVGDTRNLLKDIDFFGSMFNTTTGTAAFSVGIADCGQVHTASAVDAAAAGASGTGWGAVGGRPSSSSSSGGVGLGRPQQQQQSKRRSGSWLARNSVLPGFLQPAHAGAGAAAAAAGAGLAAVGQGYCGRPQLAPACAHPGSSGVARQQTGRSSRRVVPVSALPSARPAAAAAAAAAVAPGRAGRPAALRLR